MLREFFPNVDTKLHLFVDFQKTFLKYIYQRDEIVAYGYENEKKKKIIFCSWNIYFQDYREDECLIWMTYPFYSKHFDSFVNEQN